MDLTIVIPTYNREEVLCSTLNSVLEECKKCKYDTEIIVVDQTKEHTDSTYEFLKGMLDKKLIKLINEEKPSLPAARNIGIKAANGSIIMFLDDDVELQENFINEHMRCYEENNKIAGTVGKVTICNNSKDNILLNNNSGLKQKVKGIIFKKYSNNVSVVTKHGLVISDFSRDGMLFADTVIGCNMSFKKTILDICGVFDEKYIGNAIREETDLCCRIRKKGYLIRYNSSAHLYHIMFNTGGCRNEKDIKYWEKFFYNQCYFLVKNFTLTKNQIKKNLLFDIVACKKNRIDANKIINEKYSCISKELKGIR